MPPSEFQHLVQKFTDDSITATELQQLRQWVLEDRDADMQEAAIEAILHHSHPAGHMPADKVAMFSYILEEANRRTAATSGAVVVSVKRWWAAAAAAVLLLGTGLYFLTRPKPAATVAQHSVHPILPGREGAILTLADGSRLVLDSLQNGVITRQGRADVRLQHGQLLYTHNGAAAALPAYNTMTTPRGRQFRVMLPDGTAVWLNAASSLHYPVVFPEGERSVTVTGEAYFEVAPDPRRPFTVKTDNGAVIEVLGTSFNVNAYTDETALRTTLLQGKIRVKAAAGNSILQPGEQAVITQTVTVNTHANTAQAVAWKNGIFNFQHATLEEVMRQIARWYDVEVVYEKNIPAITFGGEMGRDLELKDVLEFLQGSGVHFKLSGRKLIVMP
ncbi:DUF4974 domain-containing protein [Chitinophaga sp. Mgbs1]|uniref:DUF4974 domain-containing protein n=1 Tax=Chitinophaga solisilvae TaxID=1233460 RepID=A0A9Q5D8S5_9BACT|nr:DUF4974 domain-containing protein [Chitinophaga solisilvae]